MGDSEDERPKPPTMPGPSPWISREGNVVHPDAPAGSGGLGRFRTAGSLGNEGGEPGLARHPKSPSIRFEPLSEDEKAEVLDGVAKVIEPVRNPPPVTVPEEYALKASTKARIKINAKVRVVADGKKPKPLGDAGARTYLDPSDVTANPPQFKLPANAPEPPPDAQAITAVVGDIVVTGTATLQVQYGDDAKPTAPAAWGRGTTADDDKNKDTTVGFHESCHLADYKAYLATTPIPIPDDIFKAKTVGQWKAAAAAIDAAIESHFEACEAASRAKTDEIGTRMSDYVSTHAGVSGH